MFNFITQHRRGTTEEWQNSEIIPREGEIVFEECSDGAVKSKVGNGRSLFIDLPYTTDKIEADLNQLSTDLLTTSNRLNDHVKYIEQGEAVFPENSVETEIIDARSVSGHTYDTVGDALRSVDNAVKQLEGYIDSAAVDGLYYENDMLYLTANNQILEETGVKIVQGSGGGGGGTNSSLKISYVEPSSGTYVVTPKDKALLVFSFEGTDSSGDPIDQVNATWKVDNSIVAYGTVKYGLNEFDITKYIKVGTQKVLLSVEDAVGNKVAKAWTVQQVDVRIESNFNDHTYYHTDDVIFQYTPYGAVEKTVHFVLDNEELSTYTTTISGTQLKYALPKLTHGSHMLEVYITAVVNEKDIETEHIFKDILWYDGVSTLPLIGCSTPHLDIKQYEATNIVYTIFDPIDETPNVKIFVDNTQEKEQELNKLTNEYSYRTSEVGSHNVSIVCGEQDRKTEKTISIAVSKIDININPVTVGLAFDFDPVGKQNADEDRLWTYEDISMSVSDNFDWTNGGYQKDENGDSFFCVKAGTRAIIDYTLFGNEAKVQGKEVKLIFKTVNVADPETTFLSCVDSVTGQDNIGLVMHPHTAYVYGKSGSLELAYSENDVIEFEFNISPIAETPAMIMGYEDGVATRPLVYTDSYSFQQNTPKYIELGSDDCDLWIYRFKAYNTSLTDQNILDNFIADARNADEMIARYNRNNIYDENGKLDPDVLAEKCPHLRIYKLSAPHFTNNKSDKVTNTTIQQLYFAGDPVLDNWTCYNCQHSGQGTSSNNYGAAGRNLDFIMNKSGIDGVKPEFILGDGKTTAKEISLTRSSVPVAYLNAKVNIASSNNLTNAILANRYNQYNPYRRPFVRPSGYDKSIIKDTMEFHNCVIFIQETDPDLTTHREFADTDWHFYAIGNIGDSKKTDKTRATDPDDEYECCVEIMDVGRALSDFPADTMMNAMGYKEDETTKEKIYTWAKDENLGILYEKQDDGSYVLTSDETVDLTKTYYVDILLHDDFSEDYTYGWRYISDEEDPDVVKTCKDAWIEFYRFVTTSSNEEFKANLKNYFVIDSALYYYLFTTRYCMVDNRAKNTFWHYSKTSDGTRKWDLCWDYDNDTSLGLNNYGKQVYRYGLEDTDKDASGIEVFRESDSTFFCRIRDLFGAELASMYRDLESKNAWHAESFLNSCDAWQSEFPEELWRIDIDRKYIRTYTSSFINSKGDSQFLVNMCNGRMKYQRRQWERNQEEYMASKYKTTRASSDSYHANFRFTKPESTNLAVPASYDLTLIPYSYMYVNVAYGTTIVESKRAVPNEEIVIKAPSGLTPDIVNVYSASMIRDFGDLSSCYAKTVSVGNATRLRTLKLGNSTSGYDNSVLTEITLNTNPLLEFVDIQNISSFNSALELDKLINLKTLKAFGTRITGATFAVNGKLNRVELPQTVNSLKFDSLQYLTTNNIVFETLPSDETMLFKNVTELEILDCPKIDVVDLFNKCIYENLKKIKFVGADLGTLTYEQVHRILNINRTKEEDPYHVSIVGKVHIEELTGPQYTLIKTVCPDLDITFKTLTCKVTFFDSENKKLLQKTAVGSNSILPKLDDPVDAGDIKTAPQKPSSPKYEYTYAGWSTINDGVIAEKSPLENISNDLSLYPTYTEEVRTYVVTYKNNNGTILYNENVKYDELPVYSDKPQKENTSSPEAFTFKGWVPSQDVVVTGSRECYATYDVDVSYLYTIVPSDVTYTESSNELHITKFNNIDKKLLLIPAQFEEGGPSITHIEGFDNKEIEYVVIPETTKVIGSKAFLNNKLTEIRIPESVKEIHVDAFAGNSFRSVNYDAVNATVILPRVDNKVSTEYPFRNTSSEIGYSVVIGNNVTKIPESLFRSDVPLTQDKRSVDTLIFDTGSKCKTIESYAFRYAKTRTVNLSLALEVIGSYAFDSCEIEEIVLPDSIKSLGSYSFSDNRKLGKVNIPASVENIESTAFLNCTNVSFIPQEDSKYVWEGNCLLDMHNLQQVVLLMGTSGAVVPLNRDIKIIDEYAFYSRNVQSIELPDTVTTIESYAFYACSEMTNLKLSQNLTKINDFGIYNTGLTSIDLSPNLGKIGSYGLANNKLIKKLDIPSNVTQIGFDAFKECSSLEEIHLNTSNVTLQKPPNALYSLFSGCEKLSDVHVNWQSDGSKISTELNDINYEAVNADAPWGAGTDKTGNRVIEVTVHFADDVDVNYPV